MINLKLLKEKYWIIVLFCIFLFSFILDIYLLTRYNLSYGMDGPYYDLQVLSVIKTGFPLFNHPPLTYYLLAPFVLIFKNSFLGIKVGMAFFASLMVFPAYFLCETLNKNGSKIPSFLCAFLITVNMYYFSLLGDFLQNLMGALFLLLFLYVFVKWLQDTRNLKYGALTIVLVVCNILTHLYTGMLVVAIFIIMFLLNLIIKAIKDRKLPVHNLKILGLILVIVFGGLAVIFTAFPITFSKLLTFISFFNQTNSSTNNFPGGDSLNFTEFLTIPLILGVLATIIVFYKDLKENLSKKNKNQISDNYNVNNKEGLSKKGIITAIYLIILFILAILSIMPSEYQNRFILLLFIPIGLLVPVGVQLIEKVFINKYPSKKKIIISIIAIIAILFAVSSFYSISESSNMGPSIGSNQYSALSQIKSDYMNNASNPIVVVNEYHIGYWVEYALGVDVFSDNISEIKANYPNSTIYYVDLQGEQEMKPNSQYLWNPFLPYSFPIGINLNPNGESDFGKMMNNISHMNGEDKPDKLFPNKNGTFSPPDKNNSMFNPNFGGGNGEMNFQSQLENIKKTLLFSSNNVELYIIS